MKMLMLMAVAIMIVMQGCGTMRGVGGVFNGIGRDIQSASDGYNETYYRKYTAPRIVR